jgi:hypothetical protein
LQTLAHRGCFPVLCFDEVVLDAEDFKSLLDAELSFCKASGFPGVARDSFSKLRTEPVNLVDANILKRDASKNVFTHDSHDALTIPDFFAFRMVHCARREMILDARDVLLVAI